MVRAILWRYFRPRVIGAENLPKGRGLIVGCHSGIIPYDAASTLVAVHDAGIVHDLAEAEHSREAVEGAGVLERDVIAGDFLHACAAAGFVDVRLKPLAHVVPWYEADAGKWRRWEAAARRKRPLRAAARTASRPATPARSFNLDCGSAGTFPVVFVESHLGTFHVTGDSRQIFQSTSLTIEGTLIFAEPGFNRNQRPELTCTFIGVVTGRQFTVTGFFTPPTP